MTTRRLTCGFRVFRTTIDSASDEFAMGVLEDDGNADAAILEDDAMEVDVAATEDDDDMRLRALEDDAMEEETALDFACSAIDEGALNSFAALAASFEVPVAAHFFSLMLFFFSCSVNFLVIRRFASVHDWHIATRWLRAYQNMLGSRRLAAIVNHAYFENFFVRCNGFDGVNKFIQTAQVAFPLLGGRRVTGKNRSHA